MAFISLLVLANAAHAGEAYCDACKGETGWSGTAKLDEIGNVSASTEVMPGLSTAQKNRVGIWKQPLSGFSGVAATDASNSSMENASQNNTADVPAEKTHVSHMPVEDNASIVRSDRANAMLAPLDATDASAIYLDISEEATEHIPGSVAIPYTEFLNGTEVRSVSEIDEILGNAGISGNDSLVIYGECMPCGGGPAPADFVYWILRSLGHENVKVLDGMVGDWASSGNPTSDETAVLPARTYTSKINSNFTADYDYVMSGKSQIVDARSIQEFGNSSIPGAINIPYESVISDNRLKDESRLERVFSILNRDQPVVVYTNTGLKASVVWFALTMLGYDARLYSYENYLVNQEILRQNGSINITE
ncbi:MAG TPA: rhodanese-like domain-containing protein [Methanothrix sp.]|nr:rhodanese-like domain-containing protein [Methanothrix sp.]